MAVLSETRSEGDSMVGNIVCTFFWKSVNRDFPRIHLSLFNFSKMTFDKCLNVTPITSESVNSVRKVLSRS